MPVTINYKKCDGCKNCYNTCPLDVFSWNEKEKMPHVSYPNECWYCGCCYFDCAKGAIDIILPPIMR